MVTAGTPLYEMDDARDRVDLDVVWGYLSTEAYWGRWRPREIVEQQVRTAWRVVGAYEQDSGAMVGFARAFSDGFAFAYLPTYSSSQPTAAEASESLWCAR